MNKIEAAITEYFGERCPEIAPGCPCCDAWIEYDTLVSTREKALREAAEMVRSTAYTINGSVRSLEPVLVGLAGMDMHHATIAEYILALIEKEKTE